MGSRVPIGKVIAAIVFAAAGKADLQVRTIPKDRSLPRSERPVYLGFLALSGLMCLPLVTLLFQTWRRQGR